MRVYITELSSSLSAQKNATDAELHKTDMKYRSKFEKLERELSELSSASETRVKILNARIEALMNELGEFL